MGAERSGVKERLTPKEWSKQYRMTCLKRSGDSRERSNTRRRLLERVARGEITDAEFRRQEADADEAARYYQEELLSEECRMAETYLESCSVVQEDFIVCPICTSTHLKMSKFDATCAHCGVIDMQDPLSSPHVHRGLEQAHQHHQHRTCTSLPELSVLPDFDGVNRLHVICLDCDFLQPAVL